MKPRTEPPPLDRVPADPIAQLIRARRTSLGLTLAELARRAGLKAPSFIHHLEAGLRLPSEEVAARLARALGEDEVLFRAWAHLRGGARLDAALEAARTIEKRLASAETGAMRWIEGSPARAEAPAPVALMRVPLLRYSADPDAAALEEPAPEALRFDARALPPEAWLKPFAYRLAEAPARCGGRLAAGDLVLLTRNAWPIHPDAIYAARAAGEIALSPLEWRTGTLWLRSAGGGASEPLPPSGIPPSALAGRVAAVIRARPG